MKKLKILLTVSTLFVVISIFVGNTYGDSYISISSPTASSTITGNFIIYPYIDPSLQVNYVEYYLEDVLIEKDESPPYVCSISTNTSIDRNSIIKLVVNISTTTHLDNCILSNSNISLGGSSEVHWGPVASLGNLTMINLFPRKIARGYIVGFDTHSAIPNDDIDENAYWSYKAYYQVPDIPAIDTTYYHDNADYHFAGDWDPKIPAGDWVVASDSPDKIYFVHGNCSLENDHLKGTLIVMGNLMLKGYGALNYSVEIPPNALDQYQKCPGHPDPIDMPGHPGLPTVTSHIINGIEAKGLIYVGGILTVTGSPSIDGCVIIQGNTGGTGNGKFYYNNNIYAHVKKDLTCETEIFRPKIISNNNDTETISSDNTEIKIETGALGKDGYVKINSNPVENPMRIAVNKIVEANNKIEINNMAQVLTTIREINAYDLNNEPIKNLSKNITVTIPYTDDDNNGFVNGTNPPIEAASLCLYYLNEDSNNWERIENVTRDLNNKTISSEVSHLSVFCLMGQTSTSLNEVFNYPNPAGTGGTHFVYNLSKDSSVKIVIYTPAGRLVKKLIDENKLAGKHDEDFYNCTDENGSTLANGIYLYKITATPTEGNSISKTGKLVIIR